MQLSTEVQVTSLLNSYASQYPFVNSWTFGSYNPGLGDYMKWYIFVNATSFNVTNKYQAELKFGTISRDNPSFKTSGSSYSYYTIYKNSDYDSSCVTLQSQLQAYPISLLVLAYISGGRSGLSNVFTWYGQTWSKGDASLTEWGTASVQHDARVGNDYVWLKGTLTILSQQATINPTCFKRMAGSTMTNRTLYGIKDGEQNKIGNSQGYGGTDELWVEFFNNGTAYNHNSEYSNSTNQVYCYRHDYESSKTLTGSVILDDVSRLAGEKVFYYSGLPLCKIDKKGHLKMKLKFKSNQSSNNKCTFQIKKGSFANSNITAGVSSLTNATCDNNNPGNNDIVNIECDVEAGDYLWIKIKPDNTSYSYNNYAETQEITLTVEN